MAIDNDCESRDTGQVITVCAPHKKGKESGHLPLPRRFSPWPDDQPTVIEFTQRSYVPESS